MGCRCLKTVKRQQDKAFANQTSARQFDGFHLVRRSLLPTSKTVSPCYPALGKTSCVGPSAFLPVEFIKVTRSKLVERTGFPAFILVDGDDDLRKLPLHLRKTNLERLLARRPEG
jgi:hypothetical protein